MTSADAFARAIVALESYAAEVVYDGGWVHAPFLADAGEGITLTLPNRLPTEGRPPLVTLASGAGFALDPLSALEAAPTRFTIAGPDGAPVDLDFLTDAEQTGRAVAIEGQGGLKALGQRWQGIATQNATWFAAGTEVHASLEWPRRVRIPTLGAYLLLKGLAAMDRTRLEEEARDLASLYEILAHPVLGPRALAALPDLAARHPGAYAEWHGRLRRATSEFRLLREMTDRLLSAGRAEGAPETVVAAIIARLGSTLAEAPAPANRVG